MLDDDRDLTTILNIVASDVNIVSRLTTVGSRARVGWLVGSDFSRLSLAGLHQI